MIGKVFFCFCGNLLLEEKGRDIIMIVAEKIVSILEKRGIQYVFGIPGEENIALVNALHQSKQIKFILVQDERAGAFMASTIGWLTKKPGVIIATLGPGALNMTLSIADAQTHSFPLIAIAAQGELEARVKETTQVVDLNSVFTPITKWSEDLVVAESTTELINKAYNIATTQRTGTSFVTVPASLEQEELNEPSPEIIQTPDSKKVSTEETLTEAANLLKNAEKPIILAGLGVSREQVSEELTTFSKKHQLPVATSFMAKGAIPETSELSLGIVGFFISDYINAYLEDVDLILAIGYDFGEFDPAEINPNSDKTIINLHTFVQETHKNFSVNAQLIGDLSESLNQLSQALKDYQAPTFQNEVQKKLNNEYNQGQQESDIPLKPAQIIHATRKALPANGKVLIDTGAAKMWMARLFPARQLNTVLINNALSSMSWAIPGIIATKLLYPEIPLLTVVGDGAFHMSFSEITTAIRYNLPLTILIWDDSGFGLIKWKMAMDLGEHAEVDFKNPDFIQLAKAYGGNGFVVNSRDNLEEILRNCLENDEGINIIVAPVDYSENMALTDRLGN